MFQELYNTFSELFGLELQKQDLTLYHMFFRALLIYIIGTLFIRQNKRIIAIHNIFNMMLNLLIGNMLASAIVGGAPYLPVLSLCLLITFLNWLLNYVTFYSRSMEKLIKGPQTILIKNGVINKKEIKKNFITTNDLMNAIQLEGLTDISEVKAAFLENNGNIAVIKKQ